MSNLINNNQTNVVRINQVRFFNVEAIANHLNNDGIDMIDVTSKVDFIHRVEASEKYDSIFIDAQLFANYKLTIRLLKSYTKVSIGKINAVISNLIDIDLDNKHNLNLLAKKAKGIAKARASATDIMNNIKVSIPKRKGLTVKKTVLEKLVDSKGAL